MGQAPGWLGEWQPPSPEDAGACAQALGPDGKTSAPVFDDDLLQRTQILLDPGPSEGIPRRLESPVQVPSEHRGKEGRENMAPNGVIVLMEQGTRPKGGTGVHEGLLHLPELLAASSPGLVLDGNSPDMAHPGSGDAGDLLSPISNSQHKAQKKLGGVHRSGI